MLVPNRRRRLQMGKTRAYPRGARRASCANMFVVRTLHGLGRWLTNRMRIVTSVGAVDDQDAFAWFSNWGSCVDVNAPGVLIRSAWLHNRTGERLESGSSMAAPHVAGVIATLLSRQPSSDSSEKYNGLTTITPQRLRADLLNITTKGVLDAGSLPVNTINAVVYSGGSAKNYSEIIRHGGWPECCT